MKLSIVIPNRNDTVMLAVTVRCALESLKSVDGGTEIIVVDNSDVDFWQLISSRHEGPWKSPLAMAYIDECKIKLIRQSFPSMYSAKQTGVEAASGDYVMTMDSHVITGYHTFKTLAKFLDDDKDEKVGFVYAPIGYMDRHEKIAKHQMNVTERLFGPWGKRVDRPTKICWNFGSHMFRRQWFLDTIGYGFFAREQMSWGGGEFYTAIKGWLLGKENWVIPTNPQYHIGPYGARLEKLTGYKFRVYGASGSGPQGIGILSAFYALGGDAAKKEARKSEEGLRSQYGLDIDRDWELASGFVGSDREWISRNRKISFEKFLTSKPWTE